MQKIVKVKMKVKVKIPRALREQVWLNTCGKKFNSKCYIRWCKNEIDVFNFQVGHNIPESKGGPTVLENLKPICCRCNQSMGSGYTIDEWNKLGVKVNSIKYFLHKLRSALNNACGSTAVTGDDGKPKDLSH